MSILSRQKKYAFIFAVLILLSRSALAADSLTINNLSSTVMSNDRQLWGRSWSQIVGYNDINAVDCEDLDLANSNSTCFVKLNVFERGIHYTSTEKLRYKQSFAKPKGIKGVLLALKAKAWAMEKGAYCQINIKLAKNLGEIYKADHSLIGEAYGDESFRLSGRKINYMTMPVPVSEAGNFYMLT